MLRTGTGAARRTVTIAGYARDLAVDTRLGRTSVATGEAVAMLDTRK